MEYKEKYQPIVENPKNIAKFKAIVEEFWLHMTNFANSDGRWLPPPKIADKFITDSGSSFALISLKKHI